MTAVDPRARFAAMSGSLAEKLYAQMALIRAFENRLLELFEEGKLFGTTHCYIGQEANAVGLINHLGPHDIIFSNHRCHGHFITYSDRPELLMAELMGRAEGLVGGRGGSQHICFENFYSNGVQGGIVANAVGMAMAEKLSGREGITTVFLGDGTLGEGIVYEALNMASLWSAPILFVVENNQWAQSTPIRRELSGDILARGRAFGIESSEIRSTDALELHEHLGQAVNAVRESRRPRFVHIETYRLCHHSKSNDMRPVEEVERHRAGDPLTVVAPRLSSEVIETRMRAASLRVQQAYEWASGCHFPDPDTLGAARA